MTPREERGLVIAALCKLNKAADGWLVPSQGGAKEKIYRVDPDAKTCTCLDCTDGGQVCKHVYAVLFTIKRELGTDGTVSETRSVTFAEKITYKQNWAAYNEAQTTEKHRFQKLLFDLCRSIPQPPRKATRGRDKTLLSDSTFASVFKIYSTVSSRRFTCDLHDAHGRGYITKPLHHNMIGAFLEKSEATPILQGLIAKSASPLKAVETEFAVDSSGFSSSKFNRWYDEKYNITRQKHAWIKVHLATGVKTNIVTAARILAQDSGDSPEFTPLVKETAETFRVNEVSADKAYLSRSNLEFVESLGATPFIPFKSNSCPGEPGSAWDRMFGYYTFRQQEFLNHYHKRSNVESTFSMIKRKFGEMIRSRTPVSMVNETLGKILAHNICVVIASQCELGIEAAFWPEESARADVLPMTLGR